VLTWLAEGTYRAGLRVAVTAATGKDPRAEVLEDLDPAEQRKRDAEALRTMAGLLATRNRKRV